jgi:hypothetical protein
MKPAIIEAVREWHRACGKSQEAAAHAMHTTFPALERCAKPTGCCDAMLAYQEAGLSAGRLCIDGDARAAIEFEGLPNAVVAEAMDAVFGVAWFDQAQGPLAEEGAGTYNYNDDSTSPKYEENFGRDDVGKSSSPTCRCRTPRQSSTPWPSQPPDVLLLPPDRQPSLRPPGPRIPVAGPTPEETFCSPPSPTTTRVVMP